MYMCINFLGLRNNCGFIYTCVLNFILNLKWKTKVNGHGATTVPLQMYIYLHNKKLLALVYKQKKKINGQRNFVSFETY